jgi:hypothetical protein
LTEYFEQVSATATQWRRRPARAAEATAARFSRRY